MSTVKRNIYLVIEEHRLLGVATSYKKAKTLPKKGSKFIILRITPEHINQRMNANLMWNY